MTRATLSAMVDAPIRVVRDTLLAAPQLPEWNPAFARVVGASRAAEGAEYALEAIRGLKGTLIFTRVTSREITMEWQVPLLAEVGIWKLNEAATPAQTLVSHSVERHGLLAAAIAHTLNTLPALRLDRLAERVSWPTHLGARRHA